MHIMTVSAFVAYLNDTFKAIWDAQQVAVEGEVSGYRVSQGQWVNFDLKDPESLVSIFMPIGKLHLPLQDGMRIRIFGWPRIYPKYGKFSLSAERIELVGEGALQKALAMLREKLDKEGLFDPTRKRELPRFPKRIALVASRESAAYGDFIRILGERWSGLEIHLYHVMVQGEKAPGQIKAALQSVHTQHEQTPYDAIVLTRGGGSLEELMCFNDESLVRALYASKIPTLVGVGHERDITLCEEVADVRGSTPTDCARRLVPDKADVLYEIAGLQESISDAMEHQLEVWRDQIDGVALHATHWLERVQSRLALLTQSIQNGQEQWFGRIKEGFASVERLLQSLNPQQVLKRGYAFVTDEEGNALCRTDRASSGQSLEIHLQDGVVESVVKSIKPSSS